MEWIGCIEGVARNEVQCHRCCDFSKGQAYLQMLFSGGHCRPLNPPCSWEKTETPNDENIESGRISTGGSLPKPAVE
jgi:hypothetical protein